MVQDGLNLNVAGRVALHFVKPSINGQLLYADNRVGKCECLCVLTNTLSLAKLNAGLSQLGLDLGPILAGLYHQF